MNVLSFSGCKHYIEELRFLLQFGVYDNSRNQETKRIKNISAEQSLFWPWYQLFFNCFS